MADTSERKPLSQSSVLDAALRLADRDGLAALTMRRLAAELGVEAMSLYHHFRNKDALLDALADGIFAELPPIASGAWRSLAERAGRDLWSAFEAHPWAAGLVVSRPQGLAVQAWLRQFGEALEGAGWRRADVRSLIWLLQVYVIGAAILESDAGSADRAAGLDALSPEVRRYVDHDPAREFRRGLAAMLDGAQARLAPDSQ